MTRLVLALVTRVVPRLAAVVLALLGTVDSWAAEAPSPQTAEEWTAAGQRQLRAGETTAALASLQQAVALDPTHGAAGLLITTLH
jgi:Tfp pilus assembly protein PilF